MRKIFLLFFAILIAKETAAITWPEAVKLLEANNNELRSAQKLLDSSGWTYRRAYTSLLPQLSASLSAGQTGTGTSGASSSYSYGLNGSLDLFNSSDYFGLQSAYADYQYNQANYDLTTAGVYYSARLAFIDLLVAQESVALQKKILARRQENSRLIELRYDSGKEDRGNLMRTRADEANAKYNLSSAERDLRLAKLNLSQLLGQTVDSAEEALKSEPAGQADYEPLLNASPAYRVAKYQLEAAEVDQRSTLSEFLPSVTLSGSYRRSGSNWPPDADSNSISLGLSYAFFPGGSNFIDRIINDIRLEKAREDFTKSVKDARFTLAGAFERLGDAREALSASRVLLDATTERSNIVQAKYINGLMSYDDWLRTENEYVSAQSSLLSAQKNALAAEAAWQKSFGGYVK
ncbi:hypothetical protein A2625_02990 [candidate division WOR-1 bacterium RIFCSPHIGHO2_01_FULL_53_15]|uniref:Transporter n=1 Tax=candidate division WOR-1 bacterium RIFCSPHIGHO2_01_FULL_53_15 TaxID=1802564 RepID=A0A1F4Q341_UNCSA|nr:MAG: hypothetical protein A2625_02990 [candidate division WOR-1 bacterium RIFCSPHIGHO2_01_FULL_53_15]OGC10391.1 MAG: hypothetical protein A3D23_07675 [candidate division WOR-1 bacterium RIFCSPHIGHO2_02_FULL_53_26]